MVGGLARFARGGEDCPLVFPQQRNPIRDVSCVPQLAFDVEMRAQERGRQFRDQLLGRIGPGAETIPKIAVEALLASRPVAVMPTSA
jgi:hypothetical protein